MALSQLFHTVHRHGTAISHTGLEETVATIDRGLHE